MRYYIFYKIRRYIKLFLSYFIISSLIIGLCVVIIVFVTGDGGYTQKTLQGIEERALIGEETWRDRLFLKSMYQGMVYTGSWKYPHASKFLHHYCQRGGDTLFFDAQFLLKNPDVIKALESHKTSIIFRPHHLKRPNRHIVTHTYWDLYYAFDLLQIRQKGNHVLFYDNYFFHKIQAKSYTPFKLGRIKFELNDGLIHVAYPQAKSFISYGKATLP